PRPQQRVVGRARESMAQQRPDRAVPRDVDGGFVREHRVGGALARGTRDQEQREGGGARHRISCMSRRNAELAEPAEFFLLLKSLRSLRSLRSPVTRRTAT